MSANNTNHFSFKDWPLWLLIILGVFPESILSAADLGIIGSTDWRFRAYSLGAFWVGLLYGWEANYIVQPVTMFVTYALLHTGPAHMLTNMSGLIFASRHLRNTIGLKNLVLVYCLSILGGALCFAALSASPRPMVGASGGIYGLMIIWVLDQAHERTLWTLSALVLIVMTNVEPIAGKLAWEAHVGGTITGALLYWLILKRRSN